MLSSARPSTPPFRAFFSKLLIQCCFVVQVLAARFLVCGLDARAHAHSRARDGRTDPLLDSSCFQPSDWARIAVDIGRAYHFYDGFVVCMGTDTMAYAASALSFMLENLGKTVGSE